MTAAASGRFGAAPAMRTVPARRRAVYRWITAATLAAAPASAAEPGHDTVPPAPAALRIEVVAHYPHDARAFTQGLVSDGATLYESTGLYGRSSLRVVDLSTGKVRRQVDLPPTMFGEGLAKVGDRLVQLTWTNGIARIYTLPQLALVAERRYDGEGWGLCHDGESLIMSDGSHQLTVRDPETFAVRQVLQVRDERGPVRNLNELECVGRHVYANVWQTWTIVRIDRHSGIVDARIDATNLLSAMEKASLPAEAVMNGIAFDAASDTFLLTGKLWPRIHRVRFVGDEIK